MTLALATITAIVIITWLLCRIADKPTPRRTK